MSDEVKSVDGAYVRIEGHEELCAERYSNIRSELTELKTSSKNQQRIQWSVLIALLGFMALQLWNNDQARLDKLEHPIVQSESYHTTSRTTVINKTQP